jgi:nicotinamide riboside kinase
MKDQNPNLIKIAVVGPESTGKSTMAAYLANHYDTVWVPEFAREYCEKLTEPPTWQDEINMFYGQLALEQEYLPKANKVLICDTTFITFGRSPQQVLDELPLHPYSLYLLLDIDLPWQEDPLRDFPHLREHFMEIWDKELKKLNANYVVVSGVGSGRYEKAVSTIDSFIFDLNALWGLIVLP